MEKKLSVIVPVYNKAQYLDKCINSILNQTYKNIELILVNDGSTDNSLSICKDYAKKDGRIMVVDKPNGGAASARNKGIDVATGDYIGFCDADDYLDLDMYKTLIDTMEQNDYPTIDCYDERGKTSESDNEKPEVIVSDAVDAIKDIYLRKGNVHAATRVTKAEYIKALRIVEGRRVEDFYFTICLLNNIGKNIVYKHTFYNYVESENSVTRSHGGSIYLDAIYFYEKSVELLGTENYEKEQEYYLLKMYYLLFISSTAKERKQHKELFKKYKKDLKTKKKIVKANPYLTKKEKRVLSLSCFSVKLVRFIFCFKESLGR